MRFRIGLGLGSWTGSSTRAIAHWDGGALRWIAIWLGCLGRSCCDRLAVTLYHTSMPKLVWALLCQRLIIDQQTNLVSYVDAFDGVALPYFPLPAPILTVATVWKREEEAALEMRVAVYDPHGRRLMDAQADPLRFEPHHRRGRMHVVVGGFEIAGPGSYGFGIETRREGEWVEVHRVVLDIERAPQGTMPLAFPVPPGTMGNVH